MNESKPKTVFEQRDQLKRENERLNADNAQLAAANRWLLQENERLTRESAELRQEGDRAKKVVDAAVKYYEFDGDLYGHLELSRAHRDAVVEYRIFTKPGAVNGFKLVEVFEQNLDGAAAEKILANAKRMADAEC